MEFFNVVKARHSIRAFSSAGVEKDKLRAILDSANRAPSAGNLQAYEIYLVADANRRAALARAAREQLFIARAPVALVFCAHPGLSAARYGERGIRLYALQDATIACVFAMLAATALGLGTVWVGSFDDSAVRRVINVPETLIPVAILPVGYPAEKPEFTPRRRLDDLVHEL